MSELLPCRFCDEEVGFCEVESGASSAYCRSHDCPVGPSLIIYWDSAGGEDARIRSKEHIHSLWNALMEPVNAELLEAWEELDRVLGKIHCGERSALDDAWQAMLAAIDKVKKSR